MFEGKMAHVKRAWKLRGIGGLCNLAIRYAEQRLRPVTVHYYPTAFQIEPTTYCNLRCKTCDRTYMKRENRHMAFRQFKEIIDSNPYLQKVNLTGIGESLLNPDFPMMVAYAKGRGINVWFNSNFTILGRDMAQKFIDLGVDEIVLSLDGGTRGTYEGIRNGANFDKVIGNVRGLNELKKELGAARPAISTNTVLTRRNIPELPLILELAKGFGAETCIFVGCISFGGNMKISTYGMDAGELGRHFAEARKKAGELGIGIRLPSAFNRGAAACDYPWMNPYFRSNGNIHPCCFCDHRGNKGLWESFTLGKAGGNFMDVWNGKEIKGMRRKLRAYNGRGKKELPELCKGCWMLNEMF